jgi:hypothetical protein
VAGGAGGGGSWAVGRGGGHGFSGQFVALNAEGLI